MSTRPAMSLEEVQQVLALTDRLGIHREAVKIPLMKGSGGVRQLPNGRLEIVIDAQLEFGLALTQIDAELRRILGSTED